MWTRAACSWFHGVLSSNERGFSPPKSKWHQLMRRSGSLGLTVLMGYSSLWLRVLLSHTDLYGVGQAVLSSGECDRDCIQLRQPVGLMRAVALHDVRHMLT